MASKVHCAVCFETLSAHFDDRQPLRLSELEALWSQYDSSLAQNDSGPPRPVAVSRLLNNESGRTTRSAASSNPSLPSTTGSSQSTSGVTTPASSNSSLPSISQQKHPLFVTWNKHSPRSGNKSLRGCIGTFEAQDLEHGLSSYALTSALEDTRFSPISASELPHLSNHVTLLTNFSSPTRDPLDWTLGTHGIRISFQHNGRKYGATYLPDVAVEQGWTKEETLTSLMRKAGWNGSSHTWQKAWRDGKGELVRYEGKQVGLDYSEWSAFKDWLDKR